MKRPRRRIADGGGVAAKHQQLGSEVPTAQTTLTPDDAVPDVAEVKTVWVSVLNLGPNMY